MLKMFCTYDSQVEAYEQPFFARSRGEAIRAISDAVSDGKSHLSRHPADYTLFECGEFDQQKGIVYWYDAKVNLGTCLELRNAATPPGPTIEGRPELAVAH